MIKTDRTRPSTGLKSITIRKAGPVRLTSAAQPLYGASCKPSNA